MVARTIVPRQLSVRSNYSRRHDADRDYLFAVQVLRHQTGVCEFIHGKLILHRAAALERVSLQRPDGSRRRLRTADIASRSRMSVPAR